MPRHSVAMLSNILCIVVGFELDIYVRVDALEKKTDQTFLEVSTPWMSQL